MSKGKVNVYVCPGGHRTVTVDREDGVTPFMIRCRGGGRRKCGEFGQSSFYQVRQDLETPTHEWFRPDEEAIAKLEPAVQDHVRQGGLIIRRIRSRP